MDNDFVLLRSQYLLKNSRIPVRQDIVRTPSGREIAYTVLEYHDAYAGVALTAPDRLLMVRVVRHPLGLGEKLWELPGGRLDGDEAPEECIRRELEEETGYVASDVQELLPVYFPEPSQSTEKLGLYLLRGLERTGRQQPEGEGLPEVGEFSLDEAYSMIFSGEIRSSWSVIGILAARLSQSVSGEIVPLQSTTG